MYIATVYSENGGFFNQREARSGEKSQSGKGFKNYFHLKRIILPLYTIWAMCALFEAGRVALVRDSI